MLPQIGISIWYMLGSHLLQLLRPKWKFLYSIFYLLYLKCNSFYSNDIPPPVYLFRLECTQYVTSTHVYSCLSLSFPTTRLSLIVYLGNFSTCFTFSLLSTVLLVTLVHRNDIYDSISGLSLLSTHSTFATIECRLSAYFLFSLG